MKLLEDLAAASDAELERVFRFAGARLVERGRLTLTGPIAATLDELEQRRPTDPSTPFCLPTMPSPAAAVVVARSNATAPGGRLQVTDLHLSDEARAALTAGCLCSRAADLATREDLSVEIPDAFEAPGGWGERSEVVEPGTVSPAFIDALEGAGARPELVAKLRRESEQ